MRILLAEDPDLLGGGDTRQARMALRRRWTLAAQQKGREDEGCAHRDYRGIAAEAGLRRVARDTGRTMIVVALLFLRVS